MKVNMIQMTRENITLHGYVSDDARDVYLELYGLSWGHLALNDTVPVLKNSPKETAGSDDLKNWHKFHVESKNLFEGRDNIIDVGSLTSRQKLSPNERQFFRDVINASMKKLYRYLVVNPWVSVNGLPVWDGDTIVNHDWKTRTDYREHACSFVDISVFGDKTLSNYRFDNGSELTSVIDNIPEDFSEYEGSDKIWNFSESSDREVDYIDKCDINNAISRWHYEQRRAAQQHIIRCVPKSNDDKDNTQNNNTIKNATIEDATIALAEAVYGKGPYMVNVEKYRKQYEELYKSWDADAPKETEEIDDSKWETRYYKIQIKPSLEDVTKLKDHGFDKVPYWSARGILEEMIKPYKCYWMAYHKFINIMGIPETTFMDYGNVILCCPIRKKVVSELLKRNRHDGRDCHITEIPKAKYDEIHQSYYIELQKSVMNERRCHYENK